MVDSSKLLWGTTCAVVLTCVKDKFVRMQWKQVFISHLIAYIFGKFELPV